MPPNVSKVSFIAWTSAGIHIKEHGVAAPLPKQGHKHVSKENRQKVEDFLNHDDNSRSDPSRTVWSIDLDNNKINVPVRYLDAPVCQLYETFAKKHYTEKGGIRTPIISMSQFYKIVPAQFKDPRQQTGMQFSFAALMLFRF